MGKYRSRLQIIADILSTAKNRSKKTWIMYQANLSYIVLKRYLADILEAGLVSFGGDCYMLTRKGEEYLNRYEEYAKRCRRLEDQLNDVDKEKMMLERMVLNVRAQGDQHHMQKRFEK